MQRLSMTGFARASGALPPWRWAWELKSVNGKGLDLRLRTPPGFAGLEQQARALLSSRLGRGVVYANLTAQREAADQSIQINEKALTELCEAVARQQTGANLQPASLDGLLAIRGIVELKEPADNEEIAAKVSKAMLESLKEALDGLVAMRRSEGAALANVLLQKLNAIADLTAKAEACPGRQPDAIRARLEKSIADLTAVSSQLDPARLHQEALLMAAKADIREELDRLEAHVAAARELMESDGPAGRRLDFLAQEFGREANTLCSKSNDAQLTDIGMELRAQIEQFREQVQNIE